jgi:hypothetical protein
MLGDREVIPGTMKIRVFYPNPLPGTYSGNPISAISEVHNVTYLFKNDPIYHELVFVDDKNIRRQIIGLAYIVEETLEKSDGVDGQL